jgi:hypothetical protein
VGFDRKVEALIAELEAEPVPQTLVFCNTIESCRRVENALRRRDRKGTAMDLATFHAAITPAARKEALEKLTGAGQETPAMPVVSDARRGWKGWATWAGGLGRGGSGTRRLRGACGLLIGGWKGAGDADHACGEWGMRYTRAIGGNGGRETMRLRGACRLLGWGVEKSNLGRRGEGVGRGRARW